MNIALVHDQLAEFGGAERVLLAMSEMWPEAPIYTAFYRKDSPARERFKDKDVRVSWMQSVSAFASPLRFLAPLIWNSFDLSGFDMVISSSSWYITKGFGRGGIRGNRRNRGTREARRPIEICYCHTPPRWLYGYTTSKQGALARMYGTIVGFFMRQYDYHAAQKVDYFIANSKETQRRITKFYRRESTVIYPPIEVSSKSQILNPKQIQNSKSKSTKNYFLVVSRLAQPKNVHLAIEAANILKFPLKIAGSGPDEERLRGMAGETVEFLGHVPDRQLVPLYGGAKAFLALSTDEDFGMTPVEAMAHGTPVIAYRGGGYLESVREGKTGVFFDKPTVESLVAAIKQINKLTTQPINSMKQAKKFSKSRFQRELKKFVADKYHAQP